MSKFILYYLGIEYGWNIISDIYFLCNAVWYLIQMEIIYLVWKTLIRYSSAIFLCSGTGNPQPNCSQIVTDSAEQEWKWNARAQVEETANSNSPSARVKWQIWITIDVYYYRARTFAVNLHERRSGNLDIAAHIVLIRPPRHQCSPERISYRTVSVERVIDKESIKQWDISKSLKLFSNKKIKIKTIYNLHKLSTLKLTLTNLTLTLILYWDSAQRVRLP